MKRDEKGVQHSGTNATYREQLGSNSKEDQGGLHDFQRGGLSTLDPPLIVNKTQYSRREEKWCLVVHAWCDRRDDRRGYGGDHIVRQE